MGYFIVWLVLCFLVGAVGKNKNIGYWGTFFISLVLSPLIGLIVALVSKEKKDTREFYNCGKCGMRFEGRQEICPHCNSVVEYSDTIYNCGNCGKPFKGKKERCPHCNDKVTYKEKSVDDIRKQQQQRQEKAKEKKKKELRTTVIIISILIGIILITAIAMQVDKWIQ